jgi:hypothetical protein
MLVAAGYRQNALETLEKARRLSVQSFRRDAGSLNNPDLDRSEGHRRRIVYAQFLHEPVKTTIRSSGISLRNRDITSGPHTPGKTGSMIATFAGVLFKTRIASSPVPTSPTTSYAVESSRYRHTIA